MSLHLRLLLLATLGLPVSTLAQTTSAPSASSTEPDQEVNMEADYNKIHIVSSKLRGVQAANQTVYRVSPNNQQLAAYQEGKLLWSTNVVAPFKAELPAAHIVSIVLASNVIFVKLGARGMAEVDRKTGKVVGKYFDRDPNYLVADPK